MEKIIKPRLPNYGHTVDKYDFNQLEAKIGCINDNMGNNIQGCYAFVCDANQFLNPDTKAFAFINVPKTVFNRYAFYHPGKEYERYVGWMAEALSEEIQLVTDHSDDWIYCFSTAIAPFLFGRLVQDDFFTAKIKEVFNKLDMKRCFDA